jgi:hypothetical protein
MHGPAVRLATGSADLPEKGAILAVNPPFTSPIARSLHWPTSCTAAAAFVRHVTRLWSIDQ